MSSTDSRRPAVKVLLIHPDPDKRFLLRSALEPDARFSIAGEAESGDEGVSLAIDQAGLVLLDCSLPDSAVDFTGRLAAAWPAAGVVIRSPSGAPPRVAGRAAGAVGFLSLAGHTEDLAGEVAALAGLVETVERYLGQLEGDPDGEAWGIRHARHFAAEVLSRWGVADLSQIVVLLLSEVLTNAIVHAGSDVLVLVCLIDGGVARVEVSDRSTRPPLLNRTGDGESGRGLRIVERLSRRWGTELLPGRGKTVWFEVERPGQAPEDKPGPDATRPESESLAMLRWETDGGA